LALGAFILYSLLPRPRLSLPASSSIRSNLVIPLLILIPNIIVQLHNAATYTWRGGTYDWGGHVDYIKYLAANHALPAATEGWEMFQPPLYYACSAVVYIFSGGQANDMQALRHVQIFGALTGIGTTLLAWRTLATLFPRQRRLQNLGLLFAANIPLTFCLNPFITNEIFAGFVIALAIYFAATWLPQPKLSLSKAFFLGLVLAAAMLSKYTGLFIVMVCMIMLVLRCLRTRANFRLAPFAVVLLVPLALGGFPYLINTLLYHNPLIGNWDKASGFHYFQVPGYRTLRFYTTFGQVLFHSPGRSMVSSFFDGIYGTFYTDGHGYGHFLNFSDPTTPQLQCLSLMLALIPTAGLFLGIFLMLRHLIRHMLLHPYLVHLMVVLFTIASVIAFTMRVPTYSTIKAWYLLSLIPSLTVFAALGLNHMAQNLARLRYVLYAALTLFIRRHPLVVLVPRTVLAPLPNAHDPAKVGPNVVFWFRKSYEYRRDRRRGLHWLTRG